MGDKFYFFGFVLVSLHHEIEIKQQKLSVLWNLKA